MRDSEGTLAVVLGNGRRILIWFWKAPSGPAGSGTPNVARYSHDGRQDSLLESPNPLAAMHLVLYLIYSSHFLLWVSKY